MLSNNAFTKKHEMNYSFFTPNFLLLLYFSLKNKKSIVFFKNYFNKKNIDKQKNKNVKYFPIKLKILIEHWIIQESKGAFIKQ